MFPTKPQQIARALTILWWTQGAALAGVLCVFFLNPMRPTAAVFLALPFLFGLLLVCMLLVAMAQGRNWARIFFLFTAIYGCGITVLDLVVSEQRISLITAFDVVLDVATICGLVLLFGQEGNSWFRPAGKSDESPADAMKLGNWIRRSLLALLSLVVLWFGLVLTIFFHDPGMALLAFTTDAFPRIPASVSGAFLRFAPYDPNGAMWTGQPLFKAACAGYGLEGADRANSILTIRMLAAKGADVDVRENGYTALHEAVLGYSSDRDPELIRTLLEVGADPSLRIVKPGHRWHGLDAIGFARALDQKSPKRLDPIIERLR